MKKESALLFLVLVLILMVQTVSAKFNEDKVKTWSEDYEKFKNLDIEKKNSVWSFADYADKKKFIEGYLKEEYPENDIEFKGFGRLKWQKYLVIGTDKATVDLENLPEDVKRISYLDKYDGIKDVMALKLINDATIRYNEGEVKYNGEIGDIELKLDNNGEEQIIKWSGESELNVFDKKIQIINSKEELRRYPSPAFIEINGDKFNAGDRADMTLKILENGDLEIKGGYLAIDKLESSFRIRHYLREENGLRLIYNKEGVIPDDSDYLKFNENDFELKGNNIQFTQGKHLKDVRINGNKIDLMNGNAEMRISGDKTFFLRDIKDFKYNIDNLVNLNDKENPFTLKNGEVFDKKGENLMISTNINTASGKIVVFQLGKKIDLNKLGRESDIQVGSRSEQEGILNDIIINEFGDSNYGDTGTNVHENTHMVNNIFNKARDSGKTMLYGLKGGYVNLENPKIKLSEVGKSIPLELQDTRYELYFKEQQKYFEDSPLYVMDELTAYNYGGLASVEINENPRLKKYPQDNIKSDIGAAEFAIYSIALHKKISESDNSYLLTDSGKEYERFLAKQLQLSFNIYNRALKQEGIFTDYQERMVNTLRTSNSKEVSDLRNFITETYDEETVKLILGQIVQILIKFL